MKIRCQSKTPAHNSLNDLLFSATASSRQIFPGGCFLHDKSVLRRWKYLTHAKFDRIAIQRLLAGENSFTSLTVKQKEHLQQVGEAQTIFIMTGQQPGLLGGPALWFYKALTCIALAKQMTEGLGVPVIPLFWVAGDDSDLTEVNALELLEIQNKSSEEILSLTFSEANRLIPVGDRKFSESELKTLWEKLNETWKPETIAFAKSCVQADDTFATSFKKIAQAFLGEAGILFVDGYSPAIRAIAKPKLSEIIAKAKSFEAALDQGSKTLERTEVMSQVRFREGTVHAFVIRNGERERLLFQNNKVFGQKHLGENLLENNALDHLEITHDVVSRPLIADFIFPLLGHVLGPSELKYFAQLAPIFMQWTGDMPLLQPRQSAAIMSEEVYVKFQNLQQENPAQLLPSALKAQLIEKLWNEKTSNAKFTWENFYVRGEDLHRLHITEFQDKTSLDLLEKRLQQVWNRYLQTLKRQNFNTQKNNFSDLFSGLNWLGKGRGQDRHMNMLSLLNIYGWDGIAETKKSLDSIFVGEQLFTFTESVSLQANVNRNNSDTPRSTPSEIPLSLQPEVMQVTTNEYLQKQISEPVTEDINEPVKDFSKLFL